MRRHPGAISTEATPFRHQPVVLLAVALLVAGAANACTPGAGSADIADRRDDPIRSRGVDLAELEPREGPVAGDDYAILIATSGYDHWSPIPNPIPDAEAVGRELSEVYGFEVDYLIDPTKHEIHKKLRDYATSRKFQPEDQLLIFIAGHGIFDDLTETGYLVAKDSRRRTEDPTFESFVSLSSSLRLIDRIPANHILLVADTCFGGTLDPRIASRGDEIYEYASNAAYLQRKLELRTRRYVTSGGNHPVPDGVEGQHSPFTRALLEGLRRYGDSNGILTLDELIADHLQQVSPLPRWGEFGDNDPGSTFLFVVKTRRNAPDPAPLPPRIEDAVGYCDAGGHRNTEKSLHIFRQILEELPPGDRARLDPALLARAEEEYLAGAAQKACWLYKALLGAPLRQQSTL